jgi:hypothetical protein
MSNVGERREICKTVKLEKNVTIEENWTMAEQQSDELSVKRFFFSEELR